MGFRDYPNTKCICIAQVGAKDLEKEINRLQKKYHIIDLQFSTHFENVLMQHCFCALLLVQEKES